MVTEAWHENGQDYVTAYIDGSMLDHTVDEVTGALVEGSNTVPKAVDAFLTFTRATGLNPWMLGHPDNVVTCDSSKPCPAGWGIGGGRIGQARSRGRAAGGGAHAFCPRATGLG